MVYNFWLLFYCKRRYRILLVNHHVIIHNNSDHVDSKKDVLMQQTVCVIIKVLLIKAISADSKIVTLKDTMVFIVQY